MIPFAPFHPIHGADLRDEEAKNTRVFVGDGTPWLKVPGCLKVESVSLPNLPLPDTIEYDVPVDHTLTRLERVVEQMYDLAHQADGTPVLRRNRRSNDGIWQAEVTVMVTGEWDETASYVPPPEPEKTSMKGRR